LIDHRPTDKPLPTATEDRYLEALDHEQVLIRRGKRSGLNVLIAVHSTLRGPSLGGCRMWGYGDSRAALRDGLRLSRAMTLKAAVADLPLGGGKGVIALPAGERVSANRRRDVLLDFADAVEAVDGAYITAEDVGTSSRDMRLIASRTRHVAGLPRRLGGSGDPSPFTALGIHVAIRTCCRRVFGAASLRDRSIAVVGLGHVGARLAKRCAAEGARLLVSDIDDNKRHLADELGAEWVPPDRALRAAVDVLSPCALGAIFDDATVPRLSCAVIAGGANNQLAEDRIADRLEQQGILWAPDFVVNAGGVINISDEFERYDPSRARRKVRGIESTLDTVIDDAQASGCTPLAAALALARVRLALSDAAVAPHAKTRSARTEAAAGEGRGSLRL
jgi:leucine dehydrogenase